jgi:hypothetical protein
LQRAGWGPPLKALMMGGRGAGVTADLSPLEQAAARVGLPGLKARVVPHDRRRGWWFRWERGELLVSDRILDRCPPADACALLIDEVLRRRNARGLLTSSIIVATTGIVLSLLFRPFGPGWIIALVGFTLIPIARLVFRRARDAERADDATVALLGDATPLVRGLNEMNFEEIHLAGKVLPARPDLHRRAERLVRKYRLCEAQPPA